MKRFVLFSICSCIAALNLYAEEETTPLSFYQYLKEIKSFNPEKSATELSNRAYQLNLDRDSFRLVEDGILRLSTRLKNKEKAFVLLNNLSGLLYKVYADYDQSLYFNGLALKLLDTHPLGEQYFLEGVSFRYFILAELGEVAGAIRLAKRFEDSIPPIQFLPGKSYAYRQLSIFYYEIEEYDKSIDYAKAGLVENAQNGIDNSNGSFLESIACGFDIKGDYYDSAIYYRLAAIKFNLKKQNFVNLNTAYGNLAVSYSMEGNRKKAEEYFSAAREMFQQFPFKRSEVYFQTQEAEHYIRFDDLEKAKNILDTLAIFSFQTDENELLYYHAQLQYFARVGEFSSFQAFQKRYDSLSGRIRKSESEKIKQELLIRYETQKRMAENEHLSTELDDAKKKRLIAFLVSLLLIIGIVALIILRRKEGIIQKHEKTEMALTASMHENALNAELNEKMVLRKQLQSSVNNIMHEQALNMNLLRMVQEIKEETSESKIRQKSVEAHQMILRRMTEDLLDELERNFQLGFPKIYHHLKFELDEINQHELLYCMMICLEYESETIATLLQRSEKAIQSLRYRIRKKLAIDDSESLLKHLLNLSINII